MVLKIYYDLISQPARALLIFARLNPILGHEEIPIILIKGEQKTKEYEQINRFKKVPAIVHDDFKLAETIGILRYLCREFTIGSHWYPEESKARAKVDEALAWQTSLRNWTSAYFVRRLARPLRTKKEIDIEGVTEAEDNLNLVLDELQNILLKDGPFVASGKNISIADLLIACELEQAVMSGFDVRNGRQSIADYLSRVSLTCSSHYDDIHTRARSILEKEMKSKDFKL